MLWSRDLSSLSLLGGEFACLRAYKGIQRMTEPQGLARSRCSTGNVLQGSETLMRREVRVGHPKGVVLKVRPLTEGETSHPSLLPKVMGGPTWADFHSQLRILANVPLTDHMTKLPGKTFSGLQTPSYQIKERNRRVQSWVSGLERWDLPFSPAEPLCSLGVHAYPTGGASVPHRKTECWTTWSLRSSSDI